MSACYDCRQGLVISKRQDVAIYHVFAPEKHAARGAGVILNELFTKAWASAVDDDCLRLKPASATTEVAR